MTNHPHTTTRRHRNPRSQRRPTTLEATALLVGTIVGVGIFALPFAFAQAGFFVGLAYLVGLGGVMLLLHLIFGEITLRTKEPMHLVGYGERYCGLYAKWILTAVVGFSTVGASLVYIIISGQFLQTFLSTAGVETVMSPLWLSVAFFVVVSVMVYRGVRLVARGELLLAGLLVAIIVVLAMDGADVVALSNLTTAAPAMALLPYGVVLFSLAGDAAIPEMREILTGAGKEQRLRRAIIAGTVIPIVLYGLFTLTVVGVSGSATTPEPFQGLVSLLGPRVIALGSLFGFLAVFTSYLVLAVNFMDTLRESYQLTKPLAWTVVSVVPFAIFLAGARDFVQIVEVVGIITAAVANTMILLVWWRARRDGERTPEYRIGWPRFIGGVLITVFVGALVLRFFIL